MCEPMELVVVDVPEQFIGIVTERLGERRGRMVKMANPGYGRARLEYRVPSRGLIGFRGEFLTSTRGTGAAQLDVRRLGALGRPDDEARRRGPSCRTAWAWRRRTRCTTSSRAERSSSRPAPTVYEGMIVGEHNRPNDTDVNAIKEKKLTNVRNHGKDENVMLAPARVLTIETAMEWIDADELVEVTPDAVRVRKQILKINLRPRRSEAIEDAQSV